MVRVLEFLVKCAYGFKQVKTVFSYTLVRVSLAVLVMSYVLYWVGLTTELLFMMPFK